MEVTHMDIPGLSMGLASATTMNTFSVEMLSKSLDTYQDLGQGLVAMMDAAAMEQSVNPHVGGNIDVSV